MSVLFFLSLKTGSRALKTKCAACFKLFMERFYHGFFEGYLMKYRTGFYRGIKIVRKASGSCKFIFFEISL